MPHWTPFADPVPAALPQVSDPGPESPLLARLGMIGAVIAALAGVTAVISYVFWPAGLWPAAGAMGLGIALVLGGDALNRTGARRMWRLVGMARARGWALRAIIPARSQAAGKGGTLTRRVPMDPVVIALETDHRAVLTRLGIDRHDPQAVVYGRAANGVDFVMTVLEGQVSTGGLAAEGLRTDRAGRQGTLGVFLRLLVILRPPAVAVGSEAGTDLPPTPALDRLRAHRDARMVVEGGLVWIALSEVLLTADSAAIARDLAALVDDLAEAAVEAVA